MLDYFSQPLFARASNVPAGKSLRADPRGYTKQLDVTFLFAPIFFEVEYDPT